VKQLSLYRSAGRLRVFVACLLSFTILITPIAAVATSSIANASIAKSNEKKRDKAKSAEEELFVNPPTAPALPGPQPEPAPEPLPPVVGAVTATLEVSPTGIVSPGATLTYTAVLGNTTGSDATGLSFNVPIDPHTTFVGGSIQSTPVAFDHATVITNEDTPVDIILQGQDPDGLVIADPNHSLVFTIVTPPLAANGTLGPISDPTCDVAGLCSATVTFTPTLNYNGSASFTFKVTDTTARDSNQPGSVPITVTAVNDPPSFTAGVNQTVNEDAGAQSVSSFVTAISPGPTNESGQTVSFIIDSPSNALFATQPSIDSTGKLNYNSALNKHGVATITYHAQDNGGVVGCTDPNCNITSPSVSFTITVNKVNDPPTAQAQSYPAQANMLITVAAGSGLLVGAADAADVAGNGAYTPTFTVGSINGVTSVAGVINTTVAGVGTFSVNASTGAFTVDPFPGATGTVSTNYTVCDNGAGLAGGGDGIIPAASQCSATATLQLVITGPVIWFVSPGAGPDTTHTGTLNNPFQLLASANTAMGINAGQRIFVYTGTTTSGVGVTLTTSQWLVGQGAIGTGFDTLMGITPPANTIARPGISTTGTSATNRPTIQGKVAMNGSSTKVLGIKITPAANIQGLTATNGSAPGVGTALTGLQLGASPTSDVIVSTTGASGSNAMGVSLTNAGGNFNFISVTTNGGLGISADTIGSGSTMNFGPVSISNRSGTGVFINNAQGTITFGATTIPNPADAGGYGIRIDNSSATVTIPTATISDPHTVTAQTDPDTDLIPNNDGDGDAIFLKNNTGSFTLSGGTLSNCGNDCIDGRTVQTLTLTNVTINTPGQETGGQGAGGHGISLIDVSGTSNLTGLLITQFLRSQVDGFRAINTNKNATVNVINCRFENSAAAGASDGNDGLFFEGRGTSNMTTVIDEASPDATHFSRFQGLFGDGIQISTGAVSSGKMTTTVKNTDFKDAYQGASQTGSGNNGLRIAGVGGGKHAVDIQNNVFLNVNKPLFAQGVISLFINDNSEAKGTIAGNTITNATQAGIQVFADNAAGQTITDMDLIIQNNTMDNISSQGIIVQMTVTGGTLAGCDFRILNNNIGQTTPVGDGEVMFGFAGGFTGSAEGILFSTRGTAKTCNLKVANNNVKINANGVNAAFPPSNEVLQLSVSESATLNATVQNNQLLQLDDFNNGAAFFGQSFGAGTPNVCLDFTGNTGNTSIDFFLQKAAGGSFVIENVAGVVAANTGVWSPANPSASGYANSAGCTEPPVGITQLWVPDKGQKAQKGQKDYLAARSETALQNSRAESLVAFLNTRTGFTSNFGSFAGSLPASFHSDTLSAPMANETLSSQVIAGVEGWRESSEFRVPSFEFRVETEQDNQKAERDAPARIADAKSEGAPYGSRIVKASYELDRGSSPRVSKGSVLASEAKGTLPDGRATAPNAKVGNRNDIRLNHARRALKANDSATLSWTPTLATSLFAPMFFSGGTFPVNGTGPASGFKLPNGKTTTITFQVTVKNPPNLTVVQTPSCPSGKCVSNQGTLSGSNVSPFVTDDPNTVAANDATITPVDLFDTTIALASTPSPPWNTSQAITLDATVTSNPSGNPTAIGGTVIFQDGATVLCAAAGVSGGVAHCAIASLAAGAHSFTAKYNGDGNFDPSAVSSPPLTGTPTASNTTMTVTSSLDPSYVTQSVTFTATVTSAGNFAGPPTGQVEFRDNGALLATQNLVSGVATLTTSSLVAGDHPITGKYLGDANFNASAAPVALSTDPQNVLRSATTATLNPSSPNPSTPGQSVTFVATVTSTPITPPTGTVDFLDGATVICNDVTKATGVWTCVTTSLVTEGPHNITAVYNQDATFDVSPASNTIVQQVSKTATTTTVISSQNPAPPGTTVTYTATVSTASGTPGGTVTFQDAGFDIVCGGGSSPFNGTTATCTFNYPDTSNSPHPITAVYSGDGTFAGSTGTLTPQQVITSCSASVVVTNANDTGNGSLRDAIASGVCDGGTITFDPVFFAPLGAPYTITLGLGEMAILNNMTIVGPGANILVVDGNNASRIFDISAGKTVTISGMTITKGRAADGPTGTAGTAGSPGANGDPGTPSPAADDQPGNPGSTPLTPGSTPLTPGGTGTAGFNGGAILNNGTLNLIGVVVSSSHAGNGGTGGQGGQGGKGGTGGAGGQGGNTATATQTNGGAGGNGGVGGVGGAGGQGGQGGQGGGIYNAGTLTLDNTTIRDNQTGAGGLGGAPGLGGPGGDFGAGGAPGTGGTGGSSGADGVQGAAGADGTVSGTVGLGGNGGGIAGSALSVLTITNSTISGNKAHTDGGGIYHNSTGNATLTSVTVSNNTADNDNVGGGTGGGLNVVSPSVVILKNTIVSGNFKGTVAPPADDIAGAVDGSSSFNLIGDGAGMTGISNADANSNQVGINPLLGALGNNGGPTPTHELLATSPAIDAGNGFAITTLSTDITTTVQTTFDVADASGIPAGVGFTIRIDGEQMVVTSKSTNTLTVTRGANPATHTTGANVYPAFDQRGVVRTVNFDLLPPPGAGDDTDIGAFEKQIPSPTISKAFGPVTIQSGGTSTVTLTLTNPNAFALTGASFTDTLTNISAVGGAVGGTCAGANTNTLGAGATGLLSFSGITIPGSGTNGGVCTVTFDVTSSTLGVRPNSTSGVTTTQTPTPGAASSTVNLTVLAAPTIAKVFGPPATIQSGGTSTVTLTLSNPNSTALTGAAFTDMLVNGMTATAGNVTGSCNAAPATLNSGDTALSFSGITIPSNGSCTVIFNVTSSTPGDTQNTTSGVTSAQTSPSVGPVSNTATLTVLGAPTIVKTFGPATIQTNGTSTVTMTLTNPNTTALTGASFSDTLANMVAVGGAVPGTCTGTTPNSLGPGDTVLSFSAVNIPGSGTNGGVCTVTFAVTSAVVGVNPNSVSGVTTTQTPSAGLGSSANLTVLAPPLIGKVFGPDKIQTGGTSTVTLTLTNLNATQLTGASFTDTLVNMSAVGGAAAGTCTGANGNTLGAGATALSFSGITIPDSGTNGGICTVTFAVTSSTVGTNPNSTSGVTTAQTPVAGSGSITANLSVFAPPTVLSITRIDPNPTNLNAVNFLVTFSKPVTGVGLDDFTTTTTGILPPTAVTNVTPAGPSATYTVTVGTGSGDGTLRLNVVDDDTIQSTEALALPLGGSGAGNGNFNAGEVYTVSKSDPFVTSIVRADANPTNAASVNFTVTFSKPVTGVDATDFALTNVGITGSSTVNSVVGGPSVYTVNVLTGTGTTGGPPNTIRLDLIDNDTIQDSGNRKLGGTGAGNGNFTTGLPYDIDKTAPTLVNVIKDAGQADPAIGPTSSTVINFTVTFSEAINSSSFTASDVTLSGSAGATVANVSGSGTTYNVAVEGMVQSGPVTITIPVNAATDPAGNGNSNSGTATVQYLKDNFTTLEVNTTDDSDDGACTPLGGGGADCTLREAIFAANNDAGAETITFNSTVFAAPGPYTTNLTGALPDLSTDMTIAGPGAKVLTVRRDTGGDYRIFFIPSGNVTIDGLTMRNGNGGLNAGGGINNLSSGTVNVTNSTISGNSAVTGGGIATIGTTLNVSNTTISGNLSPSGGGIYAGLGTVNITNSTISGNAAASDGGGVLSGATLTISNSTIAFNRADSDNNASGTGGGIFRSSGTVTLRNTIVGQNFKGLTFDGGVQQVETATVVGTITPTGAGNAKVTVTAAGMTNSPKIVNVAVANNDTASVVAGKMRAALVADTDVNAFFTVTGATDKIILTAKFATANDATMNIATANVTSTGLIAAPSSANTIAGAAGNGDDISGAVNSEGFNLILRTSGATITETLNAGTNITHQDPQLFPLADNGGPTFTHALQCTSPAIDKGFNFTLTTDQRGGVRPFDLADAIYPNAASPGNGSDIGAYETQTGGGCQPTAVPPAPQPSTNEDTPTVPPSITLTGTYSQNFALTFAITQSPAHGSLGPISAPSCIFGLSMVCTATVIYTPSPDFNGPDSFKFKTSASGLDSDEADVNITVVPVNDPPVANGDLLSNVAEDSGVRTIPFADLTANDSPGPANEAGQALTVISVSSPLGGTVGILGNDVLFTPTANYHGPASFQYKIRDNGTTNGLPDAKDSVLAATASFTINPVADTPTVTSATTIVNTQTTSGLVITRNAADGAEVTNFKITNIQNGNLFQTDGTTPILNDAFITVAEGGLGLKFTPANNLSSPGTTFSFQAQASLDNTNGGLGGSTATATITVNCGPTLVTNSNDSGAGSLRAIIGNACPGSTITFDMTPGHVTSPITLSSQLSIDKSLTIQGPGANLLTIAGNNTFRLIDASAAGVNVSINGLSFTGGGVQGGATASVIEFNNAGTLTLANSEFFANSGAAAVSVVSAIQSTGVTVDGSTFRNNTATHSLKADRTPLRVVNSTFSGNTGAAIHNSSAGSTVTNSTIANNQTGIQSDSLLCSGCAASVTVTNTLLSSNSNLNLRLTGTGTITSGGHNLIDDATAAAFTAADPTNVIIPAGTARIAPLANNGGPTQTHALLAGSPALDAGDNAAVANPPFSGVAPFNDQRGAGFPRIVDGPDADTTDTVDIGAFEALVSVEDIPDKATNEDTQLQFIFNVGGAASITSVTATSANTTLVPNAPVNIAVTGSGSTRTLTINPAANEFGTSVITVTVNGTNGQSMTDTFVLTVNSANDAPTFNKGADQNVSEDAGAQSVASWATNMSAGPPNEPGQTLAFLVTGNTNPGLFSAGPAISPTGTLTYTPATNANGSASITIVLKDNGGTANGGQDTSAPQTFTITVGAVNDAPVNHVPGPQTIPLNASFVFSVGTGNSIFITDLDAGSDPVQVTLKATDGTITLNGTAGLSFSAGDGTDDQTMTFTGSIANINAALEGMKNLAFGTGVIEITTNDLGHNGVGGALSDTDTIQVTVIDNLAPVLLTAEGSDRAIALDSVTLVRDPFALLGDHNFSSDHRTRITLFALHAQLKAGETASAVTAEADVSGTIVPLTIESVRTVPNFDWLTQVVVKFPVNFSTGGGGPVDARIRISLRGANSNQAVITIVPAPPGP
jgi:CSLREA domain-containing protein